MQRTLTIKHNGVSYHAELGRIGRTFLGVEDHGIFTAQLHFDFAGSGQSAGGYALDTWDDGRGQRVGTAYGLDHILRILDVCAVTQWEAVQGLSMIALRSTEYGSIVGLAHPYRDLVFIFEAHAIIFKDHAISYDTKEDS